jgi:hypothetical protein
LTRARVRTGGGGYAGAMLYKVLGIVVWKVGKWLLKGRYGKTLAPKPVLAGGLVVGLAGIALAVARGRNGSS